MRQICVLSGCDYLPSFNGMGLKTALKMVKKYHDPMRVVRACRLDGNTSIPDDYEERFRQAMLTFDHQQVFDPISDKPCPLTPIPEGTTWKMNFVSFLSTFVFFFMTGVLNLFLCLYL